MEDMARKFADALIRKRKELGLTQEELAVKVGTVKQVVCKYEKGQRSPKISTANAFAKALGTTLNEMLEIEEIEDEPTLTKEETEMLIAYREADSRAREDALKMLKEHKKSGVAVKVG